MANCDITLGRAFPCKDAIGGIKNVYFVNLEDSEFDPADAGVINGISGPMSVFKYELMKNTGSFVQTLNDTMVSAGLYYTQVLTIQFPKLDAATHTELDYMLRGRLVIVVTDANGNAHVMGAVCGAELTAGTFNTGAAKGDLQGYELTFTAEEVTPAPFLAENLEEGSDGLPVAVISVNVGGLTYQVPAA